MNEEVVSRKGRGKGLRPRVGLLKSRVLESWPAQHGDGLCPWLLAWLEFVKLDHIQPNPLDACAAHVNRSRRPVREIDDPPWDHRSPVVDSDDYTVAVADVGDLDASAQRQSKMGRRQVKHVIGLAAGRGASVEVLPIP